MRSAMRCSGSFDGLKHVGCWSSALALVVLGGLSVLAADVPPPAPANPPAVTPAVVPADPAAATQPSGPQPKLRIDKTTHEFPDTWAGDKVEHAFIVHNDGEAPLEIINVKPACGCTVAGQFDKSIPPGKEGKIPLALNTAKQNILVTKTIAVETNDPANRHLTLTLKGNVKMRIVMEPIAGAAWGKVTPQSPENMTVKLRNNTEELMKLEPIVDPNQTMFEATVNEVEPGKAAEVVVKLKQPVREGTSIGNIRYKTGIAAEPEVTIPCNAYKAPLLEIRPSAISASLAPGQPYKTSVIFQYNGEGVMKIAGVKASDEKIETQLNEREIGKTFDLNINMPAGFTASDEQPAQIVVNTDVKDKEEIVIPIRVRVNTPATQPSVVAEALVGKPAPAVAMKDPDGRIVNIGGAREDVTVINFWATWCGYCKRQLPTLHKVNEVYSKKGVRFLNVSTDAKLAPKEIVEVSNKLQVTIPIALDPTSEIANKYGAIRVPTLFLINKKGVIEKVIRGNSPTLEADLKADLDALLAGKALAKPPVQPAAAPPAVPPATKPAQAAAIPPLQPGPALIVEPANQDIGQHKPGQQIQHTINYRNAGSQPLAIKSIKPSDGLQVEAGYAEKLEPGAAGALKCTFSASKKPGPIMHQLALETNDPSNASKVVKLSGFVRPYIEFQPPTGVNFPRSRRTQNIPSLVTLVYNGEGSVEYSQPESSSPKFEAKVEPIPNGPYAKLEVKAKPPFEPGENNAVIHIKTTCKEQPMVDVPVKLFLPARIEITPAEVVLPTSTRLQRGTVVIKNNGEHSLNILGVKSSNEQIRTQFFPEPDGMSYKLMLIVPAATAADADKEERNDKVTIRTDDPEFGEIVIPVRVGGPAVAPADKVSRGQ